VYIREAFGSLWSFLYGWMILCSIATGALAAVAMGFGNSLGRLVPLDAVGGPITVAALTIIALTVTNYLGIRAGAIVTNVLTASKILLLAFIIGGGILLWSRVGAPLPVPNAPAPRASLLVALAAAFPPVLFTIGGWQQLNMVAGEIREPARTIPRALVAGILIVIACYLGANAVYLHALGRDGLAASPAVAADVATRFVGPMGARVIAVGVALSVLGFVNVVILSNSRIVYAMARDGLFVPSAGRVHPRFASPHVAIVLMGAIALGLLLFTKGNLGQLLAAVVFADWIFFGLGAASVFALRRKHPEWPRPYRVIGYPIVPAFFVLAAMIGVVSAFVAAFDVSVLGTALLLVGVGAFKYFERSRRASTGASSVER
jgi:APA family basic amino acid/polyamine antiporter